MQFFTSISIARSIPKTILLSLSILFISCESAHPMMYLFGNTNSKKWVKGETYKVCDELLKEEDYKALFEELNYYIYQEKSRYALRWFTKEAVKGHVPLQYFYVSYVAQQSKNTVDKQEVENALVYIIMSLIRAFQDLDWLAKTSNKEELISEAVVTINKMKKDYATLWQGYIELFGFDYESTYKLALKQIKEINSDDNENFISPFWICCTSSDNEKNVEFISLLLKRKLAMLGSKDFETINNFRVCRLNDVLSNFEKNNTTWDALFTRIKN